MYPHQINIIKPPPPPSPGTSFSILAISIAGILVTAIFLLSYYVFVIKCCFNWNRSDVLRHLSRSRRRWGNTDARAFPSLYLSSIADRGLEESVIQAIPTLRFRRGEQQSSCYECAVCLNEFQDKERIRFLPNCLHLFHIDCIDTWLQSHTTCPLCRAQITTSTRPFPVMQPNLEQSGSVVIDVTDVDETSNNTGVSKEKKLRKFSSLGEECIDMRGKDEQFSVQPIRRSFSMDSCSDRQLYMAVQEILMQNPHFRNGEGTSTGSGRSRRSFFSFSGHCRTSKNAAVIPFNQNEHY